MNNSRTVLLEVKNGSLHYLNIVLQRDWFRWSVGKRKESSSDFVFR